MNLEEIIKGRRSIRIFQEKEVEPEKLRRLIDAAQWAPSACNKQLWEFVVVSDEITKERIVEEAKSVRFLKKSPVVIFVLYPRDVNKEHAANIQSAAAAIENMLLTAYEQGLGCVWVADCGRREVLHKIMEIPRRFLIVSAVCLGYSEKIPPAPKRRELKEIIHFEKYRERSAKRGYSYQDWTEGAIEDYRQRGIRATSPFADFFENLSDNEEFQKEVDIACQYISPKDKVLDVLSFSGNHILEIMSKKGLNSISIHDVSDDIYYFVKERKERLNIGGELDFNRGGLVVFSYPSGWFDVVTCFKKINLVSDPEELLLEIRRVLKDGGRFILSFWNSRSLSGIYQWLKQIIFHHFGSITNEGLVVPASLIRIRTSLKKIGMEIFKEEGVKLCPRWFPSSVLLSKWCEKMMPGICQAVCIIGRKR